MGVSCLHGLQLRLDKELEEFLLWVLLYVLAEILRTPVVLLASLRVKLWLSRTNLKLLHLSELILFISGLLLSSALLVPEHLCMSRRGHSCVLGDSVLWELPAQVWVLSVPQSVGGKNSEILRVTAAITLQRACESSFIRHLTAISTRSFIMSLECLRPDKSDWFSAFVNSCEHKLISNLRGMLRVRWKCRTELEGATWAFLFYLDIKMFHLYFYCDLQWKSKEGFCLFSFIFCISLNTSECSLCFFGQGVHVFSPLLIHLWI